MISICIVLKVCWLYISDKVGFGFFQNRYVLPVFDDHFEVLVVISVLRLPELKYFILPNASLYVCLSVCVDRWRENCSIDVHSTRNSLYRLEHTTLRRVVREALGRRGAKVGCPYVLF